MPTYEYRCPNGHDFEKFFRSISSAEAETAIACPVCGEIALRQLSSSAGLMFKGSGFYLTDYGKNAHGKKAPPATAGSAEGSASGGGESSGDGGKSSGGSGESSGVSGGSGESKGGGAASASSGDGAAKGAESKKSSKSAGTPPKPSSGKPSE